MWYIGFADSIGSSFPMDGDTINGNMCIPVYIGEEKQISTKGQKMRSSPWQHIYALPWFKLK